MRILSPALESLAIRTACSGGKAGDYIIAGLSEHSFAYPPAAECWRRISKVIKKRGEAVGWDDLLGDPVISEKTRRNFSAFEKEPLRSKRQCKALLERLTEYRRMRSMFNMAKYISEKFDADSIDTEEMLDELGEMLAVTRGGGSREHMFTHIGVDGDADDVIESIIKGTSESYIPTGIAAFDRKNRGIPLGSLFVIAGTTGGGKSALVNQLSYNMANWGARVCEVPLEMTTEQQMTRRVSQLTKIPMERLIKAGEANEGLTKQEEALIRDKYSKYKNRLKKIGAVETVFRPEEDMTIDDILYTLKPFAYDVIIIDYIGLLKGVDGDDQWRELGKAARFAKVWAANNNCIVILCAQLSEQGAIRYSRAVQEHASNMWTWVYDDAARETNIINVQQPKSRNQQGFPFQIYADFSIMTMRDLEEGELERSAANDDAGPPKVNSKSSARRSKEGKRRASETPDLDQEYYAA
jgi:archaellum biogenesis ATPase FlaH